MTRTPPRKSQFAKVGALLPQLQQGLVLARQTLCEDCPPVGYPTNKTRCTVCPRGDGKAPEAL